MNEKKIEKKPKRNLCIVMTIAIALAFLVPTSAVFANVILQDDTIISVDPATQTVNNGDSFTVDIYVVPGEPVCGVEIFKIYYDENVITATGVTYASPSFFDPYDTMTMPPDLSVPGVITGIAEFTMDTSTVTDSNVFCTISFTADNVGTSVIDLEEVDIFRPDNTTVIAAVTDGEVQIGEGSSVVEWDVTLNFDETGGKKDSVVFGEAPDANDGPPADSYDAPKVPEPMQPYIRAWFDDNLPEPYNKSSEDYRRYPDTDKTWELYVIWKCSISNLTDITISWNIDGFTSCEYNSVVLWRYDPFDMKWDFAADMLVSNNYVYTPRWFNMQWLTDQFQIIATGGTWNNRPYEPSDSNPIDGATGVDINADLSWTGGDQDEGDIVTYDIYLGTASNPPKIVTKQSDDSFDPTLSYDTTYYWKIVSWDNHSASTHGPIWSFTTEGAPGGGGDPPSGGGDPPSGDPPVNTPPIADASACEPYHGSIDSEILFDGTLSHDPDDNGYIKSWEWDFDDGKYGSGEIVTHIYSKPGTYTVILTVTNNEDAKDTDEITAIIGQLNNPPTAPVVDGVTSGDKDTEYTYTAVSTDLDGDNISYFFDWDDDTENTKTDFFGNNTIVDASHMWTSAGVYMLKVSAEDENNAISGITKMMVLIDVEVEFIDDVIQGYLLDLDNDGIYDIFHNNATGNTTTVELQEDGTYLIDSDSDTVWDYEYNPQTNTLIKYSGGGESSDEETDDSLWYLIGIVIILLTVIFIMIYGVKKLKERQQLKKEVRRRMKENAEQEAKEAEEQEDKL